MTTPTDAEKTPQRLAADTIRTLAMDAVQKANSGHPGMPMGMADTAVVLWSQFLRHNPANPEWPNRDRFVLSAGHGSMLIYSLLHLAGYDVSLDDLKNFRQLHSKTPGHPENFVTPGIETTTGPLGQGISNAVGMALAERHMAARFNQEGFELFDHLTYVIASDGDLMEGISYEACSLAGHWKLGRLIVLWDDNGISIDGSTDLSFTEDVQARFRAQGWDVQEVDGHDHVAVAAALSHARGDLERPSLIACKTHIGFGSPNKQDSASSHGSPLGDDEIAATKEQLGWPTDAQFLVPEEATLHMRANNGMFASENQAWNESLDEYRAAFPELGAQLDDALAGRIPEDLAAAMPAWEAGSKAATRAASGKALDGLKEAIPYLIGGSADLTGSNKTKAGSDGILKAGAYQERYIHFGVREHGMAAIANGMNLHGGVRVYCGTFLIFSDYMKNSIRLAALMELPTIFVFTHDSIGLGEDGPTHQPIEQLAGLRAIPNLSVFRPADGPETSACWEAALRRKTGPSALILTRQGLPTMAEQAPNASRGGYVVAEVESPDVILIGTGSEVEIAVAAGAMLYDDGISARVVSIPCVELFEAQDEAYRESVLPASVTTRVTIEAGSTYGWSRYAGSGGRTIGIDRFGASAPYQEIYEELGLTPTHVADAARELLGKV